MSLNWLTSPRFFRLVFWADLIFLLLADASLVALYWRFRHPMNPLLFSSIAVCHVIMIVCLIVMVRQFRRR